MRDKKPTRVVTLSDMFPSLPRWELIRSVSPMHVRYRVPLRVQIAIHEAKAKRDAQR